MIDMIEQTQLVIVELNALELPALPESQPADRNPALVYLAGLSEGAGRRAMLESLKICCRIIIPGADPLNFPWGQLRYPHTRAIRAWLSDSHYAPASSNRHLAGLRGVLKEAWRLGLMGAEEYQRAVDLKTIRGEAAPAAEVGRHLTTGELNALLASCCDRTASGARDAAVIAISYVCGLRRAELVSLLIEDFDADAGTLTIRRGKGRKERIIPITPSAIEALKDWLYIRGALPGPLFLAIKNTHVVNRGFTPGAVWKMVQRRAETAGVKAFSPHDLRRTFAGDLLDAGADISTVQKLMGHAEISTTVRYDRRDAKAKRTAVNKLHIAYRRQWEG